MPTPVLMSVLTSSAEKPVFVPPVAARSFEAGSELSQGTPKPPGFIGRLRATRPSGAWLLIALLATLLAFGGGLLTGRLLAPKNEARVADVQPEKREGKRATTADEPKPARPLATQTQAAGKPAEGGGTKQAFNAKAAKTAVDRAAARTKGCRNPRDPAGSVSTAVTFAPSGKVSDVTITTPRYIGTKTGACIESRLREARVSEFSGSPMTVKKSVTVR
jgi:hypothetical protein